MLHRVVIVGGGFAGLYAARALKDKHVEVTVIDRRNFHLFQPLALSGSDRRAFQPWDIASPLRVALRDAKNIHNAARRSHGLRHRAAHTCSRRSGMFHTIR